MLRNSSHGYKAHRFVNPLNLQVYTDTTFHPVFANKREQLSYLLLARSMPHRANTMNSHSLPIQQIQDILVSYQL
jgi:hypothetical protein